MAVIGRAPSLTSSVLSARLALSFLLLATLAGIGCRRPSPDIQVPQPPATTPNTISRSALPGWGVLVVLVRGLDAPDKPLPVSMVMLLQPGDPTTLRDRTMRAPRWATAFAGDNGVARLDSVPSGDYDVHIRRVGYDILTFPVRVEARCTQSVVVELVPGCGFHQTCPARTPKVEVRQCPDTTRLRSAAHGH